jgi:hypothetical protein
MHVSRCLATLSGDANVNNGDEICSGSMANCFVCPRYHNVLAARCVTRAYASLTAQRAALCIALNEYYAETNWR